MTRIFYFYDRVLVSHVFIEAEALGAALLVEVARRRFFEGKLTVKEISIGTEVLGQENERRNVSTREIKLEKKD